MKELENDIILFSLYWLQTQTFFQFFRISGIDVVLCLRMNWCRWKLVDCLARIMMGFGLHVNRHYVIKFNDFFTQITQSSQFCTHFLQKIDQQKIANKIVKTQSTRSHVDTLVRLVSLVLIAAATTTLLNCLPHFLLLLLSAILDWTLLLLCLFLMCDEYFLSNIFPFFIPFVSPLSNSHTRPPQIYQTMEIILPFFSLCLFCWLKNKCGNWFWTCFFHYITNNRHYLSSQLAFLCEHSLFSLSLSVQNQRRISTLTFWRFCLCVSDNECRNTLLLFRLAVLLVRRYHLPFVIWIHRVDCCVAAAPKEQIELWNVCCCSCSSNTHERRLLSHLNVRLWDVRWASMWSRSTRSRSCCRSVGGA